MSDSEDEDILDRWMTKKLGAPDPFEALWKDTLAASFQSAQPPRLKPIVLTKQGLPSLRQRTDYSRQAKKAKTATPWAHVEWLQMLDDPNVRDPDHPKGKQFRREFRVPYPIFLEIIRLCITSGDPLFNYAETNAAGQLSIPLELKVMMVLRTLAGGLLFHDAAQLSQFMSEGTANKFFKDFNERFRHHYEKQFIRPQTDEEFAKSSIVYARLGLPGCVGSVDATFVGPWDGCD